MLDSHSSSVSSSGPGYEVHVTESTRCFQCLEAEEPKRRGLVLFLNKNTCAKGSQEPDLTSPLRGTAQLLLSRVCGIFGTSEDDDNKVCTLHVFICCPMGERVEFPPREEQDAVAFVVDC